MLKPILCLIAVSTTLVLSGCAGVPAKLTTAEALPGHTFAAVEGNIRDGKYRDAVTDCDEMN